MKTAFSPKMARYLFFTEDFFSVISSLQSNNILYNNFHATSVSYLSYLLAFPQACCYPALLYY